MLLILKELLLFKFQTRKPMYNKFMRKSIFSVLFISLLFPVLSCAKTYRFAYTDYPPFIAKKNDKVSGFLVDKIYRMFPNDVIEWVALPLDRMSQSIRADIVDASVVYVKTPEREKALDFTEKSITVVRPYLCTTKKLEDFEKNFLSYLNQSSTMVVPQGNAHVTHMIKKMGVKAKLLSISLEGDYIDRSLRLIAKNRASFALMPALPLYHKVLKSRHIKCVPVGKEIGIPFALKKGNKDLLKTLNDAITDQVLPVKK